MASQRREVPSSRRSVHDLSKERGALSEEVSHAHRKKRGVSSERRDSTARMAHI